MSNEITPAQMEIYRQSARRREAERKAALEKRYQRAWKVARQAAAILKTDFGASRVVVFGSLVQPKLFHPRSDINLAVWDVQHYLRALGQLLDIDPEIEVDLVPVDEARPGVLEVIMSEGVEL